VQGRYDERFEREMGCTEAEWLQWLRIAAHGHGLDVGERDGEGEATVPFEAGALRLRWRTLPPRVIALLRVPRLHVAFAFEDVPDAARQAFMRRFDLLTQRGGG
jgi:hypothetical protein